MSITASSLIALVEARGANEASAQLLEVGAASDTAGTKLKSLAVGGLLVAGAAAIGVGVASVKMAADFEQSTNLLITSAGEIPANIDLIRKGLLQMSVDTATPIDELTKGMFNIESAGYRGAQALMVEKAAAEGAKVENADLTATTGILVTAMHNFHEPASQATDVMNSFRMAASMGVMHLDDLNAALKNVLPIASQAGVKLTDVEAAISTMSLAGDKGASAGTHLSQMLTYLLAPSSKATSALKEVGLTTQEISDEMKVSLPGTVQMITDAVGEKFPVGSAKYLAALSAIVGGNKSMKAILELSGISLKTFTDDAAQLGPTMTANSTAVDGWNTVQSNFNFKMQAAKDAVDALMITLGTKLLPVVGQVVSAVTPLITGFSDWITKSDGLSGAIDQVRSAFAQVYAPVKLVVDVSKPLLDTFDRATALLPKTAEATKPLLDTFDRATAVIKKTTDAVNPLVAIFKYWKPVIEDVFKDVQILAGDVLTFATGVVDAAEKSGFFQSALQFLHDELPVVGTFLVNAGDAINQNLLPPLESLITNVGSAAAGFIDWADKSGVAKTTLDTLGASIQLTTEILGPLIQAVSDVVGWLGGGGAGTDTLVFALSAAATAFTLLKIADTTAQFGSFISKLQEGDGIITNLASSVKDKLAKAFDDFMANQAPNLKASMDGIKVSAEEAAVAEEEVAAAPADASAAGWFANLESSLGGVGTAADETSAQVGGIGIAAETSAGEVAASSTEMEASLAGVGTAATGAEGSIAAVGTSAATAGAGVVSGFGVVAAGIMTAGIGAIVGIEAYMLKDAIPALIQSWTNADFKPPARYEGAMDDMKNQSHQTSQQVSSDANDMKNNVTTDAQKMAQAVVAAGNQMADQMVAKLELMRGQGVTDATKFSDGVIRVFDEMKTSGIQDLSQLDDSAKSYLQEIQDYVDAMNGQLHLASDNAAGRTTQAGLNRKNQYASGTDYAPGGPALVGERGMELVLGPQVGYLPRGSKVIPNDQLMHGGSGWGGGGSNQPIQINLNVDGQTFASLMVDHMGNAIARDTRLHHSRRAF